VLSIRFEDGHKWWVPGSVFERLFQSALDHGHVYELLQPGYSLRSRLRTPLARRLACRVGREPRRDAHVVDPDPEHWPGASFADVRPAPARSGGHSTCGWASNREAPCDRHPRSTAACEFMTGSNGEHALDS